jgi:hypothetical protein
MNRKIYRKKAATEEMDIVLTKDTTVHVHLLLFFAQELDVLVGLQTRPTQEASPLFDISVSYPYDYNGDSTSKYQKRRSCQAHVCCRAANKNRLRQSVTTISMSYKAVFQFLFLQAVFSYRSVLCFMVLATYLFV